jgi:hypothetical protein
VEKRAVQQRTGILWSGKRRGDMTHDSSAASCDVLQDATVFVTNFDHCVAENTLDVLFSFDHQFG